MFWISTRAGANQKNLEILSDSLTHFIPTTPTQPSKRSVFSHGARKLLERPKQKEQETEIPFIWISRWHPNNSRNRNIEWNTPRARAAPSQSRARAFRFAIRDTFTRSPTAVYTRSFAHLAGRNGRKKIALRGGPLCTKLQDSAS